METNAWRQRFMEIEACRQRCREGASLKRKDIVVYAHTPANRGSEFQVHPHHWLHCELEVS